MGKQLSEAICEHELGDGLKCGKPATALVEVKRGVLSMIHGDGGMELGRGISSQHRPICYLHIASYPDYDGQRI